MKTIFQIILTMVFVGIYYLLKKGIEPFDAAVVIGLTLGTMILFEIMDIKKNK
jgi:hypothetical protein